MLFRNSIIYFALLALALGLNIPDDATSESEGSQKSSWIVIFHSNISPSWISAHHDRFQLDLQHQYEIGHFRGYAAIMNASTAKLVAQSPEVSFVEPDRIGQLSAVTCQTQTNATWGLDRINEVMFQLDGNYSWDSDGAGVRAYIIDTGIASDPEFEGRSQIGVDYSGSMNAYDQYGHGTHIAGIVGSKTFGVAKKVTLVSVKIAKTEGGFSSGNVISGINFSASDPYRRTQRGVINLSLTIPYSNAVNQAVAAAVSQGIPVVVAAGNDNGNACSYSPSSESSAITVAASDRADPSTNPTNMDIRASFSNMGSCVDIFAPGTSITSVPLPWYGYPGTVSGTSTSAAFVTGAVARLLSKNPNLTPAEVKSTLISNASNGMLNRYCNSANSPQCRATPNLLLYTGVC